MNVPWVLGASDQLSGAVRTSGDTATDTAATLSASVQVPQPYGSPEVRVFASSGARVTLAGMVLVPAPHGSSAPPRSGAVVTRPPLGIPEKTPELVDDASIDAPDALGDPPLLAAVRASDMAAISDLLERGAKVNSLNSFNGACPLAMACQNGDLDVVSILVAAGAAVDAVDSQGLTPLHHAIRSRHDPVARALVAAGAGLDTVDATGESALMHAVDERLPSVVRLLLEHGADAELATPSGETPLMRAARTNNPGITRILLAHGCDVRARNNVGDKAFDIAVACGSFDVTKCLLREDPVQRAWALQAEAEARRHGLAAAVAASPSRRDRRGSFGLDVTAPRSIVEHVPVGADPEDDEVTKVELDLAFGLAPDVWAVVKEHRLWSCADRLANIEELRSASDFNRIGRRALVRAGLSTHEVYAYLQAVRMRLADELEARSALHLQDSPWFDHFATCKAFGAAVDRFFGITACCRCLCFCCAGPAGFGDGVEERAVAAATPQQRAALARETLEAMDEYGQVELDNAFDPDAVVVNGCCADPAVPGVFRCCGCLRPPSKLAVEAMGGVVGRAQGIEFFGPGSGTSAGAARRLSPADAAAKDTPFEAALGSTVTEGARFRLQRQAAIAALRRLRQASAPGQLLHQPPEPQNKGETITWGTLLVGARVLEPSPALRDLEAQGSPHASVADDDYAVAAADRDRTGTDPGSGTGAGSRSGL